MVEMTKEQKKELVKRIVPEMILKVAKESKNFHYSEQESIENFNGDTFQEYVDNKIENENYILKTKESYGGYEGTEEVIKLVYSLTSKVDNSKIYFRINGWYNVWNNNEWSGFDIVEPKEVRKIEWIKQ